MVLSSMDIFMNTARVMESIRRFLDVPKHESFLEPFPHGKYYFLVLFFVLASVFSMGRSANNLLNLHNNLYTSNFR